MPKSIDPKDSPMLRLALDSTASKLPENHWWNEIIEPQEDEESEEDPMLPIPTPLHSSLAPIPAPPPFAPAEGVDPSEEPELPFITIQSQRWPDDWWQRVAMTGIRWPDQQATYIADHIMRVDEPGAIGIRSDYLQFCDQESRAACLFMPGAGAMDSATRSIIRRMFPGLLFMPTDNQSSFTLRCMRLNAAYQVEHLNACRGNLMGQAGLRNDDDAYALFNERNLSQVHRNAQISLYEKWAPRIHDMFKRYREKLYLNQYNLSLRPLVNFRCEANVRLLQHMKRMGDPDNQFMSRYSIDPRLIGIDYRLEQELPLFYAGRQLDSSYTWWNEVNAVATLDNPNMPTIYAIHPLQITPVSFRMSDRVRYVPVTRPSSMQLAHDSLIGYLPMRRDTDSTAIVEDAIAAHRKRYGSAYYTRGLLIVTMWMNLIESLVKVGRGHVKPYHLVTPMNRTICRVLDYHLTLWEIDTYDR